MAIVTVKLDTSSNDFSVEIDGKSVGDVTSACFYKYGYDDKVDVGISLESKKENGLTFYQSICANEKYNSNDVKIGHLGDKNEFTVAKVLQPELSKSLAALIKRK